LKLSKEFNMRLNLMLEFLQNMKETFLSYRVPMMKSFNPKGTYRILSFGLNSFIYPPRFLCSKGVLNVLLSVKNCRTLSNGQRGEIYEINGDQVAVIFDPPEEKLADDEKDEANEEQHAEPAVYWVDSMLLVPNLPSATFSVENSAILTLFSVVL
jgi:hypothetical protein